MRNNKVIHTLIVLLFLSTIASFLYTKKQTTRVAYVDNVRLMENSNSVKKAGEQINAMRIEKRGKVDTLALRFQEQLADFEKNRKSMSAKEKQLSEELLNKKRDDYIRYSNAIDEEIKQNEIQIMNKVVDNIELIVQDYGKKKGYDFILGDNQQGNILYASKAKDITDKVIHLINK